MVVGWLAPIALALLLITTNVRATANSLWLYEQLFDRNQVPLRTGIGMPGLRDIGAQIQDYFRGDTEPLEVIATVNGVEVSLFDANEVSHMADVKRLFGRTYLVQALSAVFLAIAGVAALVAFRGATARHVASWVKRGAVIAGGVIVAVGAASVVAFNQLFLLFHYIGFPQGNFTFNSQRDYLVRVFPNGFWEDITFVIGALTLVEAAALFGVVIALQRRAARRLATAREG